MPPKNRWMYRIELDEEKEQSSSVMSFCKIVKLKYTNRYVDGQPEVLTEVLFEDVMLYASLKGVRRSLFINNLNMNESIKKFIKFIGKNHLRFASAQFDEEKISLTFKEKIASDAQSQKAWYILNVDEFNRVF